MRGRHSVSNGGGIDPAFMTLLARNDFEITSMDSCRLDGHLHFFDRSDGIAL